MRLLRLTSLLFLFSLTSSVLASECGQPISVDTVAKLSGPLTLGGLRDKFGEWCQGHGPVSLYKDTDGNEIWFFWKASSQPPASDAERLEFQVLTASVVKADDPGEYQIIWPKSLVGMEIRDVLAKEYESLESK